MLAAQRCEIAPGKSDPLNPESAGSGSKGEGRNSLIIFLPCRCTSGGGQKFPHRIRSRAGKVGSAEPGERGQRINEGRNSLIVGPRMKAGL